MKDVAKKVKPEKRKYHLQEHEGYGQNVFRITDMDATECWYGFIFTSNNSKYRLKEKLTPRLSGAEVIWPLT